MTDPLERIASEATGDGAPVDRVAALGDGDDAQVGEDSAPKAPKGLMKLFQPTEKKPVDFKGGLIAVTVNRVADNASAVEAAEDAELGESTALCVDAVGGPGRIESTPAFYLGKSMFSWVVKVRAAKAEAAGARR